jgi:hypothetical protein
MWQDKTTYLCPDCPFDSLAREDVVEHHYQRHVRPYIQVTRSVLYDADGHAFEILGQTRPAPSNEEKH